MSYQILIGDVLDRLRELPDESVHCVVTSPPYWGLRDYGVKGQIGLEKTPAEYLAKMTKVFREVRRVLRSDGTCWMNMGDSYASSPNQRSIKDGDTVGWKQATNTASRLTPSRSPAGSKPKDLMGMPWRLAFALQEDGWWLRQDIIWSKPNPMPESVTDRCTKAHEYIFLLTKSARYFYDAEAIRQPFSPETKALSFETMEFSRRDSFARGTKHTAGKHGQKAQHRPDRDEVSYTGGANKRSVWEIATEAFPEAHFATFPTKLVEPCILAGTSEKGCCSDCGDPWTRIVESSKEYEAFKVAERTRKGKGNGAGGGMRSNNLAALGLTAGTSNKSVSSESITKGWTKGWTKGCNCDAKVVPCTVLDPFNGSGTTGVVALRYHRNYIGIELNPEYAAMAERRIGGDNPMFNRRATA